MADCNNYIESVLNKLDTDAERRYACQELFQQAVADGRLQDITDILDHRLLSTYVDVNVANGRGETPAVIAMRADQLGILKTLVEHGCNPFTPVVSGRSRSTGQLLARGSILEIACREGHTDAAKYLISVARNPRKDASGSSHQIATFDDISVEGHLHCALISSAQNDHVEIVQALIDAGVDVNSNFDNDIGTALHEAARCNSLLTVDVLLSVRGVDIEALATERMMTPLMCAAEFGHVDIILRLLLAGADINKQTPECSSALIVACHFGHQKCVDLLIGNGANPHLRNPWGFTATYMGTDSIEILRRLLKEFVNVNERCGDREEVPLHLASVIGSVDAVELLLNSGANINSRTVYNENALWIAAWKGHAAVAKVLIQNNIDLNEASNGWQVYVAHYLPLEVAMGLEHYEIMKMLLLAGCCMTNTRYYKDNELGPFPEIPWVKLRFEVFDFIRHDNEEMKWLKRFVTTPSTLSHACRLVIRALLGVPFQLKLNRLPIPSSMKDFLMMKSMETD